MLVLSMLVLSDRNSVHHRIQAYSHQWSTVIKDLCPASVLQDAEFLQYDLKQKRSPKSASEKRASQPTSAKHSGWAATDTAA